MSYNQNKLYALLDHAQRQFEEGMLSSTEKALIDTLVWRCNRLFWNTSEIQIKQSILADMCNISVRQLLKVKNSLYQKGFIFFEVDNRGGKSKGIFDLSPFIKKTLKYSGISEPVSEIFSDIGSDTGSDIGSGPIYKEKNKEVRKKKIPPLPPQGEQRDSTAKKNEPKNFELSQTRLPASTAKTPPVANHPPGMVANARQKPFSEAQLQSCLDTAEVYLATMPFSAPLKEEFRHWVRGVHLAGRSLHDGALTAALREMGNFEDEAMLADCLRLRAAQGYMSLQISSYLQMIKSSNNAKNTKASNRGKNEPSRPESLQEIQRAAGAWGNG